MQDELKSIKLPLFSHKRVSKSNVYISIPKGNKYLVCFSGNGKYPSCISYQKKHKQLTQIQQYITSIHYHYLGTILYGTFVIINDIKYFVAENIYYFKNRFVGNEPYHKQVRYISQVIEHTNTIVYNKQMFLCKLPYISNRLKDCLDQNYGYELFGIKIINNYEPRYYNVYKIRNRIKYAVFEIRPCIQFDIYDLYCFNQEKIMKKYGIAHIDSYKTSVFMNNLFRQIKENDNLDALEESDDEEDFENIDVDKYVFMDKKYNIKCVFNEQHKRWKPVELSHMKPTTMKNVKSLEK